MSSSYLKHNPADQCLEGLRDYGVIRTRGAVSMMAPYLRGFARHSGCVWCVLFFGGVMGVVAAEGASLSSSHPNGLVRTRAAQDNSRHIDVNRRDPFKRIPRQRLTTPKTATTSHQDSKIIPLVNNPSWRLLGVMHGQEGHQAVIQVSPTERVLVQPGAELARSGWMIKTISEKEVLLEHRSSDSLARGDSPTRTFILSFPTIQQSP